MVNFDFEQYQKNMHFVEIDISGFQTQSGVSLLHFYKNKSDRVAFKDRLVAFIEYNNSLYRFVLKTDLTVECAEEVVEIITHGMAWHTFLDFEEGHVAFWSDMTLEHVQEIGKETDVAFFKFLTDMQQYFK